MRRWFLNSALFALFCSLAMSSSSCTLVSETAHGVSRGLSASVGNNDYNQVELKNITVVSTPRILTIGNTQGWVHFAALLTDGAEYDLYCPPRLSQVCLPLAPGQQVKKANAFLSVNAQTMAPVLLIRKIRPRPAHFVTWEEKGEFVQ